MTKPGIAWRAHILRIVGRIPGLSHLLRRVARGFPEGSVVRINAGLAKGFQWRRHARYVNGYWLGHYELPVQAVLERELQAGQTFFDVGANAGFFALVGAKLVGKEGRVVAFDPDPPNVDSIREQVTLNALDHIAVVGAAVADRIGSASFARASEGCSMGHLGEAAQGEEHIEVPITTLDQARETYGMPDLVKVDVEGAEGQVLAGAGSLIASDHVTWLLELHGPQCESDVKSLLVPADYRFEDLDGAKLAVDSAWPTHVLARPPAA